MSKDQSHNVNGQRISRYLTRITRAPLRTEKIGAYMSDVERSVRKGLRRSENSTIDLLHSMKWYNRERLEMVQSREEMARLARGRAISHSPSRLTAFMPLNTDIRPSPRTFSLSHLCMHCRRFVPLSSARCPLLHVRSTASKCSSSG